MDFVDLDKEIEKREGKAVQEVFAEKGEDYFRQVESQVLLEWIASKNNFVMATGGGTPCFYQGIAAINASGLSIFLDAPVHVLLARLEKKTDRPLLKSSDTREMEDKLNALRNHRLKFYQQAAITVDNPDLVRLLEAIRLRN